MSQMFPNFVLAGSNGIHVESQIPCIYLCIDLAIANNSLGTLLMRLSLGHPVKYQYMKDLLCLDTCCPTGKPSYSSVLDQVHSPCDGKNGTLV